jgi:hypothetical protein
MKKPLVAPRRTDPAVIFRKEIELAKSQGADEAQMVLKLTLSDASRLKRDPNVAVSDIAFRDGVMHFLGVRVEQGGVSGSALETGA